VVCRVLICGYLAVAIWVLEYCYVVAKVFWWLLPGPSEKQAQTWSVDMARSCFQCTTGGFFLYFIIHKAMILKG